MSGNKGRGNPRSRNKSGDKCPCGTKRRDTKNVPHSRGAPKRNLRERVIGYLEANSPMELTPKTISSRLRGASHEAVKKTIQRELLTSLPRIVLCRKGWYRSALNMDRLRCLETAKHIGLHGIKLEGKCPPGNTGYSFASVSNRKYRKRGIYSDSFNGRVVTITVHEGGLVEVWLRASKNPLGFDEFDHFCYWVYGMFSGSVLEHSWKLSQLGINVDTHVMDLDGLQRLSLKNWRNAWFQIYQKEKGLLRQEVHIMPDMKLQDALTIMHGFIKAYNDTQYSPPPDDQGDFSYR